MSRDSKFVLDREKCIACGKCIKVCAGMMFKKDDEGKPYMIDEDAWSGRGCWGCQHCMAVCPQGAISIEGKYPSDSLLPPGPEASDVMFKLMANRRSHRRFLDKDVDHELLMKMLKSLQNLDTGGCREAIEFTVIDDKEYLKEILDKSNKKMAELAAKDEYPWNSGKGFYDFMAESEKDVRPNDLFLCGAPNLLVIHQYWPEVSNWNHTKHFELGMASAYFELLCAANGVGAIALSYILGLIEKAPELKKLYGIPDNHICSAVVAFGYPDIQYARGTQRDTCVIETLNRKGLTLVSGVKGGHYSADECLDEMKEVVIYNTSK